MRRATVFVGLTGIFLFSPSAMEGQAAQKLRFEVASVRRDEPNEHGGRQSGGPGTQAPERFIQTNAPLRYLLEIAFDVWPDQLSGPAWIDNEKYTIVANVPPGTSREQFQLMFQNLLIERFKMTLRHARRDFVAYQMSVGKNGHKLRPSSVDLNAPNPYNQSIQIKPDRDGFPVLPEGNFKYEATLRSDRAEKQTWRGFSLPDIATFIENRTHLRVQDQTGLTGLFDFHLQFARPQAALEPGVLEIFDPVLETLSAVQSQLGLKLERGKFPLDFIVIESADKTPIEN